MRRNIITDVQVNAVRFSPGDRLVVRLKQNLLPEQVKRLNNTIRNWAGQDIPILVINQDVMEIEVENPGNVVVGGS